MAAGRVSLRRVGPRRVALAAVATLAVAAATFHLKYAVRDLDLERDRLRARLAEERGALQVARAELAYLTRPDRIVAQAAGLGMTPGRGARIVDPGRIVPASQLDLARRPLAALLPSGASGLLKVKPLGGVTLVKEKVR